MIQMIYVSRASSPVPLELRDILASSRKNNPALNISGALCLIDGVYLQYLEGEEATVDALYRKIEEDSRHSEAKVLNRRAITTRAFPKWAMALLTWNEETKQIFRQFNPDSGLDAFLVNPLTVDKLIQTWATTSNWMTV